MWRSLERALFYWPALRAERHWGWMWCRTKWTKNNLFYIYSRLDYLSLPTLHSLTAGMIYGLYKHCCRALSHQSIWCSDLNSNPHWGTSPVSTFTSELILINNSTLGFELSKFSLSTFKSFFKNHFPWLVVTSVPDTVYLAGLIQDHLTLVACLMRTHLSNLDRHRLHCPVPGWAGALCQWQVCHFPRAESTDCKSYFKAIIKKNNNRVLL